MNDSRAVIVEWRVRQARRDLARGCQCDAIMNLISAVEALAHDDEEYRKAAAKAEIAADAT